MEATVVLIGAVAVGKSTVGPLVAAGLGRAFVDLDDVAVGYYDEVGMPVEDLVERATAEGIRAGQRWWQPARAHAVERSVQDHHGAVVALGAGHSHFEDGEYSQRVQRALADCFVVLLVAHADADIARAILAQRCRDDSRPDWDGAGLLGEWVHSAQNRDLADRVVVVAGDDSNRVAQRILALLAASDR